MTPEQFDRFEKLRDFRNSIVELSIEKFIKDEMFEVCEGRLQDIENKISLIWDNFIYKNEISFKEACEKIEPFYLEYEEEYKKLLAEKKNNV